MKRFLYVTTALATLLALSAPAAQAYPACGKWPTLCHNGPALDGRAVNLPDGVIVDGASEAQIFDWPPGSNGSALDGRQVALPDELIVDGASEAQFKCPNPPNGCGPWW